MSRKTASLIPNASDKIPHHFLCPISQEIMRDPMICTDGQTYERAGIEKWLEKHKTSPVSGLTLREISLTPNIALRESIKEFLAMNGMTALLNVSEETPHQDEAVITCKNEDIESGAQQRDETPGFIPGCFFLSFGFSVVLYLILPAGAPLLFAKNNVMNKTCEEFRFDNNVVDAAGAYCSGSNSMGVQKGIDTGYVSDCFKEALGKMCVARLFQLGVFQFLCGQLNTTTINGSTFTRGNLSKNTCLDAKTVSNISTLMNQVCGPMGHPGVTGELKIGMCDAESAKAEFITALLILSICVALTTAAYAVYSNRQAFFKKSNTNNGTAANSTIATDDDHELTPMTKLTLPYSTKNERK